MQIRFAKTLLASCALIMGASAATAADQALQPVGIIGAAAGTGQWPAVAESREDLRSHTIYRPEHMPDSPLPVLVWGNGGCSDNGLSHSFFLREVASHGYYVIALGYARNEPVPRGQNAQPPAPPPGAAAGAPQRRGQIGGGGELPLDPTETDPTVVAQMDMALVWAEAMNELTSSELKGHLDMTRIAVAGHSCGGLQSIKYAADPRQLAIVCDVNKAVPGPTALVHATFSMPNGKLSSFTMPRTVMALETVVI